MTFFRKARVCNSELFSLDIELVIQLLSSFEGRQVFPEAEQESKEEAFVKATEERKEHSNAVFVPDGVYYLERKLKKDGNKICKAQVEVEEGIFIIRAGQCVSTTEGAGLASGVREMRRANINESGIVTADVAFDSPSGAGCFVIGAACDGWVTWKTKDGRMMDNYRQR